MLRTLNVTLLTLLLTSTVMGQDLLKERIFEVPARKRSVFLDRGVFHSAANPQEQSLRDVRNSYSSSVGYERIVFDFSGPKPPRVYGKISKKEKKVYLDFFNTAMGPNMTELKNIKYLKNIDFFTIDDDNISVELQFKQEVSFDIFHLDNPARLVIDVKK